MDCPDCGVVEDLPNITPQSSCSFNINQIQRFLFGKAGNNFIVGTEDPKLIAAMSARLTVAGDTKLVVTPFVRRDSTITAGELITQGGNDNSTLNGVVEVTGKGSSSYQGYFEGLAVVTEKDLKKLECHRDNLVVYMINEHDQIIGRDVNGDGTVFGGIPTQTLAIGDRAVGGFGVNDSNEITFSIKSDWSSEILAITPTDYKPTTDL